MKYFALIFTSILSGLVYANNCTDEIENATSDITFGQIIQLVESEGGSSDSFVQDLRSFAPIVDFRQGNQFYHSNRKFSRKTEYFNGGGLEGEFIGVYFGGVSNSSLPFGLFVGFDIKSCKLRSVSYDFPE